MPEDLSMGSPAEFVGELPSNTVPLRNELGVYCAPAECLHRPCAQALVRGEVYERATIEFVCRKVGRGSVVHGGTFFGDFLPALSRAVAPGACVLAFEPNPRSFECAQWTVRRNGLKNVRLTNCGLGESNGELPLVVETRSGTPLGGASTFVFQEGDTRRKVWAPMRRLDDLIEEQVSITVIQLDVEKFEQSALEGAMLTIRRCRPILVLETLPAPSWIEGNLEPWGYRRRGRAGPNHILSVA